MTKRKLQRFAENEIFSNLIQPKLVYPPVDDKIKGAWKQEFFRNSQPIVLELGCGRGEYTVNMATMFPHNNYVGIDFKGARLWRGAKTALENHMQHVGFLRIQIQYIESYFAQGEVDEVWITFPDPQPQQSREQKRLTSPRFISMYRNILREGGIVHLKTDNYDLFQYTMDIIDKNKFRLLASTDDLYSSELKEEELKIQTTYEKIFLQQGARICYLKFMLA